MKRKKYVYSLCWSCINAVPNSHHGCSWSRKFEPVEGWEAQYDILKDSYKVLSCPLFLDEKEHEYISDICVDPETKLGWMQQKGGIKYGQH